MSAVFRMVRSAVFRGGSFLQSSQGLIRWTIFVHLRYESIPTPSFLSPDLALACLYIQTIQLPGRKIRIGFFDALAPQHFQDILQGQMAAITLA